MARSLGWKVHMRCGQRLSAGDAIHAQVRLPQTAGPRDAGLYARSELLVVKARVAPRWLPMVIDAPKPVM
jgi:hypothetical protein